MKKLFLRRHNKVIGSLKADRLKQGVSNGKVFGTDYVAESKEGPWHLVEQVILSMKAKTTPPADSTTSTNASPPAPSVSQLEQTLRQQKVELELQRKSLAERTQNLDQRERELKLQEDELPTTLNQDSTASERTRKPDALGGLELVSDSPKPVQPNTVTLPRKNPGASPGTAKLAEHWPVGAVILVCHGCQQQSLAAGDNCERCGNTGAGSEFDRQVGLKSSPWKYCAQMRDGGHGYVCTSCNMGFSDMDCPHCGTYNTVTLQNFRIKMSTGQQIWLALWIIVVLIIVGFFIWVMSL